MRRFVPLLAMALFGAVWVTQAQVPEISAPGVFVPPDLTKSAPLAGYQLGEDVVKEYRDRGVTRLVRTDYAGMSQTLPRFDEERQLSIEGFSIEVGKAGADLFKVSHRDDPFTVFTAEIKSLDAVSTRLCLDLGHLKHGEEVWLASPQTGESFGPYFSTDNEPGGLWLPRMFGDTTLLIVRSTVNETPNMSVKHIGHMFVDPSQFPSELACLTNIACESDPGVQEVRTGVGLMSFAVPTNFFFLGAEFQFSTCTGTLINNPTMDEPEPLFLTANHCVGSERVAQTTEIIWDWASQDCFSFNVNVPSTTLRVPIYLDRGANYNENLGFPSRMVFNLNFSPNVLTSADPPIFEPNPRLLSWYAKIPEVTLNPNNAGQVQFVIPFSGHTAPVLALTYSPDGTQMLSGSADGTAKIWDRATGAVLVSLEGDDGHEGPVRGVAFSPDATQVITGSADGTIKLWDAVTGVLIRTFADHEDEVNAVDFHPNGATFVSASSDSTAKRWNIETGIVLTTYEGHNGAVWDVKFSPNGNRIVTAGADETAIIWVTANGNEELVLDGEETDSGHSDDVLAVAFSPDGQRIITGSADETAKIWNAATGVIEVNIVGHVGEVRAVSFADGGNQVFTGGEDTVALLWNAANGLLIRAFIGHEGPINAVAVAPDGERATGSSDGTIRRWDAYLSIDNSIRTLRATEITTFDNQIPDVVPEDFRPRENPFLLGELVLTDVGNIFTQTPLFFTGVQAFNANGFQIPLANCVSGFSPSGEPFGCLRSPNNLTLFIPRLSRSQFPRSRVDCMLATNPIVDATLFRLKAALGLYADDPVEPAHNGRFYSGWTTRAPQVGEQILSISHPAGYDMKFGEAVITETGATRRISLTSMHEDQIGTEFTRGTILPGSSGSAAFLADGTNLIVGIASNGGPFVCINPGDVYWGSFAGFFPEIEQFIYRPNPPTCGSFVPATQGLREFRSMPVAGANRVVHTWGLPSATVTDLRLVRRTDRFPRTPSDGTIINLAPDASSHIEQSLPPNAEFFYGLFASFDGSSAGQRQFARVVVGESTGAVTYEPMSEEFDRLLNPMDLSFSQLTFVPLVDMREVALSDQPESYMNLSNYRLLHQRGVTRFPVDRGPGAIPLPFRELESLSGPGGGPGNLITGPAPLANQFFLKLPNVVPFFGRFNRDLVVSSQGFMTFNMPADTVSLTQGDFSPLLVPSFETHYQIPRISFLFANLSPQSGGSAWLRVMDDRVVLTFEEVPVRMSFPPLRNSVQTELFYNGQIRITYLQVNAPDAIVGISDGKGVPIDPLQAEFVFPGRLMSNLSSFDAPLPMQLTPIPVITVLEGDLVSFLPSVELPAGSPAPSFTAVDQPAGLTVNPNTGRIQWQTGLTDSGVYDFDYIATSGNLAASQRVVVIVEDAVQVPVASDVEVTPIIPTEDDVLSVDYEYSHIEGIPEGQSTIYWFRNGQMVYALVNQRFVPDTVTQPEDRWYAEIVPRTLTDREGQRVRSNVVFIAPRDGFVVELRDADVNLDGKVDAIDVQLVINSALSGVKTNPRTDINGDGVVNAIDVQLVINAVLE
jgi:WD40 repeat protein